MKQPRKGERGVASVELALFLPVFILIFLFGSEAAFHYRLDSALHRATASLAEIMANTTLETGESLPDRLPFLLAPGLTMLRRMMTGGTEDSAEQAILAGLRVSYYKTPVPGEASPPDAPLILAAGLICPDAGLQPLDALAQAGGLTTADNVAQAVLVRVETCYQGQERGGVGAWLFPRDFSSSFVTLRKEW
jgi:hypothetical protein